jgi:transcriptional regulator with XRE-family HTH domain
VTSLKTPQAAVRTLGEFIREQRSGSQISLRELAKQAGISNPYLSQIERGLRKPSAEILQQIAKALRISAETLYVHAGLLERDTEVDGVRTDGALGVTPAAVAADEHLTERQKQILLEIYHAFRRENESRTATPEPSQ